MLYKIKADSRPDLTRVALIAVKEADLIEMEQDLDLGFQHLQRCTALAKAGRPGERDPALRTSILDLRAAIEDILLSIRMTENELHEMRAPGWV